MDATAVRSPWVAFVPDKPLLPLMYNPFPQCVPAFGVASLHMFHYS